MSLINYFKPVETITQEQAREMMKGKKPGEVCLLDVRQRKEYETGRIPGSVLIPIAQLRNRLAELDPETPTIVYCAIGGRSRAGASILQDLGFKAAYNLKGGFKAWNGLSAEGPPETGMAFFEKVERPEEILLLAWVLEEGARRFYAEMHTSTDDPEAKKVYGNLAEIEKNHQTIIATTFHQLTGTTADAASPFYKKYLPQSEIEMLMEGQVKLKDVLAWAQNRSLPEVLEHALALEAKLYDLYFRMKEKYPSPPLNNVFSTLATEEKKHLDIFADLLEGKL